MKTREPFLLVLLAILAAADIPVLLGRAPKKTGNIEYYVFEDLAKLELGSNP